MDYLPYRESRWLKEIGLDLTEDQRNYPAYLPNGQLTTVRKTSKYLCRGVSKNKSLVVGQITLYPTCTEQFFEENLTGSYEVAKGVKIHLTLATLKKIVKDIPYL